MRKSSSENTTLLLPSNSEGMAASDSRCLINLYVYLMTNLNILNFTHSKIVILFNINTSRYIRKFKLFHIHTLILVFEEWVGISALPM